MLFRATTAISEVMGPSFTVLCPAGVQANDRLLFAVYSDYDEIHGPVALAVAGWTQIAHVPYNTNGSIGELWVFERTAISGEPASYAGSAFVTGGLGITLGPGLAVAYSGVRSGPAVVAAAAGSGSGGPGAVAPAVAAAAGASVCFWGFRQAYVSDSATPIVLPAGYTRRAVVAAGPGDSAALTAGDKFNVPGAMPAQTATMNAAASAWDAAQLGLKGAGGLTFWM